MVLAPFFHSYSSLHRPPTAPCHSSFPLYLEAFNVTSMGATGGTSTTFSVLRSYHEFPLVSSRMDFRSIKCHPGVTGPPGVYLLLYLAQCQGRTPPFTRMEKSNKTEGDNLRQLPRCQECITFSPEGEDSLTCSTVR